MIYTVAWQPSAEQALAALWLSAEDKGAVEQAANYADQVLRRDPLSQGESRPGGKRIMFVPPLVVYFEVSPADRLVTVRTVRRSGRAR